MTGRACCASAPGGAGGASPLAAVAPPPAFLFRMLGGGRREKKLDSKFRRTVTRVEKSTTIPEPVSVTLFGLFKQAVVGNVSSNFLLAFGSRKKYEAWKNNANMSENEAKRKYIAVAQTHLNKDK